MRYHLVHGEEACKGAKRPQGWDPGNLGDPGNPEP